MFKFHPTRKIIAAGLQHISKYQDEDQLNLLPTDEDQIEKIVVVRSKVEMLLRLKIPKSNDI